MSKKRGRPPGVKDGEGNTTHFPSTKDDLAVDQVLGAIAACPTLRQARTLLKENGIETDERKLEAWRDRRFPERYQEIRKQLAAQLENRLISEMQDEARLATQINRLAMERAEERLRKGECDDPTRMARDLSQVRTQAIDKSLALEGRPQQIHESRNVDELLRTLERLGVVKQDVIEATSEDA